MTLTTDRLRELLHYDPETGLFTWLKTRGRRREGSIAGSRSGRYWCIFIDGRSYYAHRLAWFYMTGGWPKDQTDHIDRDRFNNRWSNLREATAVQNAANTDDRAGRSGFRGVFRVPRPKDRPWRAGINIGGKFKHLGQYRTAEEAAARYAAERAKLYGEFARTA